MEHVVGSQRSEEVRPKVRVGKVLTQTVALAALLTGPSIIILGELPHKQGGTPGISAEGPATGVGGCPDPYTCAD
jgi:hypothetical protein